MVEVLPAQIVDVPVVLRVLRHGQLQQRQVLPSGFGGVRVMVKLHPLGRYHRSGRSFSHPDEHLVDRVDPAIPVSDVYLLVPEHHAFRAVGVERPGIAVRGLPRAGRPGLLQTLPPAGLEHFIQIGAYTDVRILRYQLQGAIARGVEAPGGNHFHRYLGALVPQLFHGRIGRARVQHHDPVRL